MYADHPKNTKELKDTIVSVLDHFPSQMADRIIQIRGESVCRCPGAKQFKTQLLSIAWHRERQQQTCALLVLFSTCLLCASSFLRVHLHLRTGCFLAYFLFGTTTLYHSDMFDEK